MAWRLPSDFLDMLQYGPHCADVVTAVEYANDHNKNQQDGVHDNDKRILLLLQQFPALIAPQVLKVARVQMR